MQKKICKKKIVRFAVKIRSIHRREEQFIYIKNVAKRKIQNGG
jgi:hypothetical protein